ncbi:MAG: hypothetical protein NC253_06230 [Ruminococcus sp.]|nr:hypothetical protein [Ruminococcus sp.]MCM1382798.1 hypothetical protein [Muribaculaceae bacterium]MCM1479414.1 hypothetical protein [Muribaculaceae bacterium]
MNNEIFKKAFENIKPPEELVNRVLDVKNVPAETKKARRRFSGKRVFGTAAAVCAVLICGITAAAVTGLIDFNAVFGDFIAVRDTELANSLAGTAKNFEYKVSDSDYKFSVKGVTGTDKSLVAVVELSRVDGTPVSEHFAVPVESNVLGWLGLHNLWQHQQMHLLYEYGGVGYGNYVNNDGNIEFYIEMECDRELIGKKVSVEGKNFYPDEVYNNFLKENNVRYFEWEDFSGYVRDNHGSVSYNNYVPVDFDDSSVLALELEWEFSFVYNPSETALKTRVCQDVEEDFVYYITVTKLIPTEDGGAYGDKVMLERTVNCTYIDVGPMYSHLNFEYEPSEYEKEELKNPGTYSVSQLDDKDNNEMCLIMSDGGTIPIKVSSGTCTYGDGIYKLEYEFKYSIDGGKQEIVKTEDVEALSINGTIYNLK